MTREGMTKLPKGLVFLLGVLIGVILGGIPAIISHLIRMLGGGL